MDTESFLARADQLLAIPSTAERPGELRRALDFVIDFAGPGWTVERFESGGKPSALVYAAARSGDFDALLAVLDPDVELRADEAAAPPGVPRQLAGAAAVSRQARTYSSRAPFGRLVLIDGAAGLALARRGRLWMALRLTVADGKITGIDVVADPDRLSRLTLALLAD